MILALIIIPVVNTLAMNQIQSSQKGIHSTVFIFRISKKKLHVL